MPHRVAPVQASLLVISQIKASRPFRQPLLISIYRPSKETDGFGGISSAPFFAGFFVVDSRYWLLVSFTIYILPSRVGESDMEA